MPFIFMYRLNNQLKLGSLPGFHLTERKRLGLGWNEAQGLAMYFVSFFGQSMTWSLQESFGNLMMCAFLRMARLVHPEDIISAV